jgi:hypothetical protein
MQQDRHIKLNKDGLIRLGRNQKTTSGAPDQAKHGIFPQPLKSGPDTEHQSSGYRKMRAFPQSWLYR